MLINLFDISDLVTVGEFTQSKGQDSWVFFNVTSLDDRVESVSLTYDGEMVKVNVSTMDAMLTASGPSDTNVTVHSKSEVILRHYEPSKNCNDD